MKYEPTKPSDAFLVKGVPAQFKVQTNWYDDDDYSFKILKKDDDDGEFDEDDEEKEEL